MRTSDEYRKIAEQYDTLASEAKSEADRLALLDLAHTWFDNAQREDEKPDDPFVEAEKLVSVPKPEGQGWRQWLLGFFR